MEQGRERTGDCAVDDCAILELDGDRLIVQFHQESIRIY
jgi:hypothetical protein